MISRFLAIGTTKWVIKLSDNTVIETVFIPEPERATLCVSSQVGCPLNCGFCATATLGFKRNLTLSEIIGQLWLVTHELAKTKQFARERVVTNVVMMGMGEPLLNFDNVVAAMGIMMNDMAYGLSKYRVTLSTSGVVPEMWRLREVSPVALAVSLHAPNDELRNKLMPINKKYPLAELIGVCRNYFKSEPRRSVTFEYVMLDAINDTKAHAKQLLKLLEGVRCKVNLIPFNEFPGCACRRSTSAAIDQFRDILVSAGVNTITRRSRGNDIAASCGQLVGSKHAEEAV